MSMLGLVYLRLKNSLIFILFCYIDIFFNPYVQKETTLASKLVPLINAKWLNADEVRKAANDWDFSEEGRKIQAKRMADMAEKHKQEGYHVVADFVCPTPAARELFNADYIVWVDTIKEGRFADTNAMFVKPEKYDYHVTTQDAEDWAPKIAKEI